LRMILKSLVRSCIKSINFESLNNELNKPFIIGCVDESLIDRGTIKMNANSIPENHLFRSPRMSREVEEKALANWKKGEANNFEYDKDDESIPNKPMIRYAIGGSSTDEFGNPYPPVDVDDPEEWIYGKIEPPDDIIYQEVSEVVLEKHEAVEEYWSKRDYRYDVEFDHKVTDFEKVLKDLKKVEEMHGYGRPDPVIDNDPNVVDNVWIKPIRPKEIEEIEITPAPSQEELLSRLVKGLIKDTKSEISKVFFDMLSKEERENFSTHVYLEPSYRTILILAHLPPKQLWFRKKGLLANFTSKLGDEKIFVNLMRLQREFADRVVLADVSDDLRDMPIDWQDFGNNDDYTSDDSTEEDYTDEEYVAEDYNLPPMEYIAEEYILPPIEYIADEDFTLNEDLSDDGWI